MQRSVTTTLARARRRITADQLIEPGQHVLAAVSGGPDSVGLLAVLHALRRRLRIELVAAHVNHRLRAAESEADERCAAAAAAHLGVPFVRCDLPPGLAAASNLEARARTLRYRALRRLAAASGCQRIATGHTRDDQAETVLLRLVRGATTRGLAGIEPRRADGVIRPLLDCTRAEIEAFGRTVGLEYRLDASNRDPRFMRTHIRHRVLPLLAELNPQVVAQLARLAEGCRAEAGVIREWARGQVGTLEHDRSLDLEALVRLPAGLRGYVVHAWLVGGGVDVRRITARHVQLVLKLAVGTRAGGVVSLPAGWTVRRSSGRLLARHDGDAEALSNSVAPLPSRSTVR